MMPFGFHPDARSEFLESVRYYQHQQSGLGERFLEAVRDAIQRVCDRPLLYRSIEVNVRKCHVVRFPYGIIYRLKDGKIEILAVMHLRRKPGYWRDRMSGN
jgi:toxin ParE1/3/4